jgi:hypothetical protein
MGILWRIFAPRGLKRARRRRAALSHEDFKAAAAGGDLGMIQRILSGEWDIYLGRLRTAIEMRTASDGYHTGIIIDAYLDERFARHHGLEPGPAHTCGLCGT